MIGQDRKLDTADSPPGTDKTGQTGGTDRQTSDRVGQNPFDKARQTEIGHDDNDDLGFRALQQSCYMAPIMSKKRKSCLFIGALGRDDNAVTLQKRKSLGDKS